MRKAILILALVALALIAASLGLADGFVDGH